MICRKSVKIVIVEHESLQKIYNTACVFVSIVMDTNTHKINHVRKHYLLLDFEQSWQKNNKLCLSS